METIIIDTDEISEFLFSELVKRGFAPKEEDLQEIADIVFEFLIQKGALEEAEE